MNSAHSGFLIVGDVTEPEFGLGLRLLSPRGWALVSGTSDDWPNKAAISHPITYQTGRGRLKDLNYGASIASYIDSISKGL